MSIESMLSSMGMHYRITDDEAWMTCPYHQDNHPSFSINTRSGVFYCFACGAKGSLAKFIADMNGVSYANAVITANEMIGHARIDKWRENYESTSFSPMSLKVTDADMALFTDPPQEALNSKNITLEAAQYYGIRWNPDHQTWVCPYHDPYSNELWGWQEKNARIFRNYPAGTKKSKTLFGINKIKPVNTTAILLESPLDCAVVHSVTQNTNFVSSFGMPSLYQLSLLQYHRIQHLYLALDNDAPGKKATIALVPDAIRMFKSVRIIQYFEDDPKDMGEMKEYDILYHITEAVPALSWMRKNVSR